MAETMSACMTVIRFMGQKILIESTGDDDLDLLIVERFTELVRSLSLPMHN